MTSTGKYRMNTTNLYNRNQYQQQPSTNNYSSPKRPQRNGTDFASSYDSPTISSSNRKRFGEDEKLTASERIRRLSTPKVLKDNSVFTHNNNQPFTYLKGPVRSGVRAGSTKGSSGVTIPVVNGDVNSKKREVIYAQVVVDPNDRKSNQRNKRTVHRSYNSINNSGGSNNNYQQPSVNLRDKGLQSKPNKPNGILPSGTTMRGKNVTTVLLNSSSDDLPSSLNERVGFNDTRYRSSSSPLLAANDDNYYPKSPGIVKHSQTNGHSSGGRSRYENHYLQRERHSTDYLNMRQSDDDEDYKWRKYREPSPLTYSHSHGGGLREASDNSDEFYHYQPVKYGGKSASTNFIDGYGYNKGTARTNYRIDEEDEYDVTRNAKFEGSRSKTLERDKNYWNRTEDFLSRSRTLDNRISSLRERSKMLEERERMERRDPNLDPYDFKLTTSHPQDLNFANSNTKRANAQSKAMTMGSSATLTKTKEKSGGSGNIFSTLLRRTSTLRKSDQKEKNNLQKSSALNTSNTSIGNNKKTPKPQESNKKSYNSNFFTSFLEKKRKKQQMNADLKKSQAQKDEQNNSYQSFGNYPSDPPSFSVVDYSNRSPTAKPYYGESNIDTEDSTAHMNDTWKKSYGADMTKVKRSWTMRESTKPNVIREEHKDMGNRTLGRSKGYTSTTAINTNTNSIDRRQPKPPIRNFSGDREEQRFGGEFSDSSFLKVPGTSGGKYNTIDTRYSGDKGYGSQKFGRAYADEYNNNTLSRGRTLGSEKVSKSYGGGGFAAGTPNSSGSESIPNRSGSHSVYLHEPTVITEIPRTATSGGGGGGASLLSGMSGRRTLSKDEISNYSGSRKETKQLSRSVSMAHPWGPSKNYRDKYNEIDYSRSNNLRPPRPPSRSPSGSLGINSRLGANRSPAGKPFTSFSGKPKPPLPPGGKHSSSVESLLRQDTPEEPRKKLGNFKLGRSKSMSVSQPKDGKGNRFSTLWFSKRNSNK